MNINKVKVGAYRILEKIAGKKKLDRLYVKYSVRKYIKSECIFVHIPKAGGTSVANAVLGGTAGHFTAAAIYDELGKESFEKLFSFTVTRNPYNRIRSSYFYVVNKGGKKGAVRKDKEFERKEFETFEKFVRDWLKYQDMKNINLLFRPQHQFICDDNGKILVDHIGKIEDLNETEKKISEALNRKINIGVNNKGSYRREYQFSDEIKEIILDKYKKDFDLFNYKI